MNLSGPKASNALGWPGTYNVSDMLNHVSRRNATIFFQDFSRLWIDIVKHYPPILFLGLADGFGILNGMLHLVHTQPQGLTVCYSAGKGLDEDCEMN